MKITIIFNLIFSILFVLKLGETKPYSEYSWFIVFLPLILSAFVSGIRWTFRSLEIEDRLRRDLTQSYIRRLQQKEYKKALKEIQNEQKKKY